MNLFVRCGVLLLFTPVFMAPVSLAADAELEALRAQVRALQQQLDALAQRIDAKERATAPAAGPAENATPATASADAAGFAIAAPDRSYQLRFNANIQADGRLFADEAVSGNDTFLLRRLLLNLQGTVAQKFAFRLASDFGPATSILLEGYAAYRHSPAFNLLFGKTKSPFDLERLVPQTDLLFIERSYPTSLSVNRDVGVQVFGELARGGLSYQLALLNGARDNDSTIADFNDGKEFVARVFAHPFRELGDSPLRGLGVGFAVSTGEKDGGTPNVYRTNAQQTFFSWRGTVANRGRHTRIEPQAYYYAGRFGLIGSWVSSQQALSPGAGTASREIDNTAWFLGAHWVLTGEHAGYRAVTPATTFSWADGTWGAWELVARYGELEIDDEAFPLFANPATAARRARGTTLGFNWHLNSNVKASLNLEHTAFDGGASNPITRDDERALLTRVQLRY